MFGLPEIFYGILGLFVGSFFNVCIHRIPIGESIVQPPSHCPECGTRIRPRDLVPVLSWLSLGRKCRECHSRISARYAGVELLTGVVFLFCAGYSITEVDFLKNLIFLSALIVVFFIDVDHQIIPDAVTLPLIVVGLLFAAAPYAADFVGIQMTVTEPGIKDAFFGALSGFAGLYLIAILGEWVFRREAMGGGDIKLAAMMGAFLGFRRLMISLFVAFLLGVVIGPLVGLARGGRFREPIPFGPMLALGAAAALFFSEQLVDWYIGRLDQIWG